MKNLRLFLLCFLPFGAIQLLMAIWLGDMISPFLQEYGIHDDLFPKVFATELIVGISLLTTYIILTLSGKRG